MTGGIIFDIKRYAIHDGPGIRTTVFFKGCPLRCRWCHNPEGMELQPEFLFYDGRCVDECDICHSFCSRSALEKKDDLVSVDLERCNLCGLCAEECPYDALVLAGKNVTVNELIYEIEKDRIFYDESEGGVTVSGGEPLEQLPFLLELLRELKSRSIHVTLDTSVHISARHLNKVRDYVDLFLIDLKMMDETKHEIYTGVSNAVILNNLRILSAHGEAIEIRIPLIAGVNDDERNVRDTVTFLLTMKQKMKVSLLPYHKGGCEKYRRLRKGPHMQSFKSPTKARIEEILKIFKEEGFAVKTGG